VVPKSGIGIQILPLKCGLRRSFTDMVPFRLHEIRVVNQHLARAEKPVSALGIGVKVSAVHPLRRAVGGRDAFGLENGAPDWVAAPEDIGLRPCLFGDQTMTNPVLWFPPYPGTS